MIQKYNYVIETTRADNSSEKGRGERSYQTLGNMPQCILYSSSIGVELWSDALMHACDILNQRYHKGIKKMP